MESGARGGIRASPNPRFGLPGNLVVLPNQEPEKLVLVDNFDRAPLRAEPSRRFLLVGLLLIAFLHDSLLVAWRMCRFGMSVEVAYDEVVGRFIHIVLTFRSQSGRQFLGILLTELAESPSKYDMSTGERANELGTDHQPL